MKKHVLALIALITLTAPPHARAQSAAAQNSGREASVQMPGFEDLADRLLPTVVNISAAAKVSPEDEGAGPMPQLPDLPPGSPFEQFFKDFYDQYQNGRRPQGGEAEKVSSLGSGFVIDAPNGYIVTNNHVIKDAEEIKVTLGDNTTLDATLVGTDEKTDIALLKVKTEKPLVAAAWGDSDAARVGSWVLAIGNPFGLGGTVTAGIISARHRDINAGPYDEFLQTDASINRGNSGGPMFNTRGEVIGINTAIFSPSGGSVGIGFAIPSNMAKEVISQLVKYGKTKRGWMGVRIQEVTPEIAETLGLAGGARGAMVSSVTPKGPADKAGLKTGDVILKFNDKPIDEMRRLPRFVAESEVGANATVTVWRKGKEERLAVTLGQLETAEETALAAEGKTIKPGAAPQGKTTQAEGLGLALGDLTPAARARYKIGQEVTGALVAAVDAGGPAADKGLAPGDVISAVDQQDVTSAADAAARIAAAKKAGRASVLFFITHGDDARFAALKFQTPKKK